MSPVKRSASPLEVFYSYSHKDEELRNELETHLALLKRSGVISGWHDRKITAGSEWKGKISEHLNSARVILLLISADFLASDYCYDVETKRALWRHSRGLACVIPVIIRACDWHIAPLSKLQALPTDGKPVTSWPNRDEAFTNIATGIREAINKLTSPTHAPALTPKPQKTPIRKGVVPATSRKAPTEPKQTRPRTKPKPGRAPALPETKSDTPAAKKPVRGQRSRQARGTTTSMPTSVTPNPKTTSVRTRPPVKPAVESMPREAVVGYVDEAMRNRPKAHSGLVWMQVVWASLRADAPMKPTLFVDESFRHSVQDIAHAGKLPLFPYGAPNEANHTTARLQVVQRHIMRDGRGGQDSIELTLYATGAVSVAMNVTDLKGRESNDWSTSTNMRINPDDVQARLEQAWSFAARWWKYRFGSRASEGDALLYNVGLFDTAHYKFERPPQGGRSHRTSLSLRSRPNPVLAYVTPELVSRSTLLKPSTEITDVIKLFEMRFDEADTW